MSFLRQGGQARRKRTLYITTLPSITWVLLGHENSPLHKKIYFRIEPTEKQNAGSAAAE
jgi:hypothetical protein